MRCRSVLAGLVVCLGAGSALADDWVMARHDAARTGASSGRTNLPRPAVRWRHYLGGGLSPNQLMITDVDGDGVTDAVYIAGTRVIAKHADGVLVWESELIEARALASVADLDGDGRAEVVVAGARGAIYVLAGDTGRVRWELPRADRAQGADARVVDVDGDGALDLYVGQCTDAPASAYAYSFRGSFDAPRRLWTLDRAIHCGTGFDNVGDLDGDGVPEVIPHFSRTELEIYSGRTGQRVATVPAPASGGFAGSIFGRFANVDDDPGQEFFVLTNFWRSTAPTDGGRRVAMYDWEGGATPGLRLRWESSWPMPDNGDVAFFHDSVADLDGDGHPEVAVSFLDAATRRWTFRLHDARTGAVLATREDSQYVGTASLGGAGLTALLIDGDRRTVAVRWAGGRLEEAWRVERHRPATLRDVSVSSSDRLNTRVMAMQFDDDPALELVMIPFDPDLAPEARVVTSLVALDVDGAAPRPLGTFNAPPQTTVLVTQQGAGLSRQYPQTVAVTSDGYLLSLDREMVSTNRLVNGEFIIPGMRVGGYFSGAGTWGHTPSIASLPSSNGGARRAVVVRDSRPALLRLDATSASLESPPRVEWERPNAAWPVLVDANGDGQTDVAVVEGRDLTLLDPADGSRAQWTVRAAFGVEGSRMRSDLVPLRRAGATGFDLVAWSSDASNLHRAFVFAGDGTPRWSAFNRVPHSAFGSFAAADLTADGTDDLVTVINTTLVIDGADGAVAREGQALPYASPVVAAFSGAEPEVYLHGTNTPDPLVAADLTPLAVRADSARTFVMGAPARCDGRVLYATSMANSAELQLVSPPAMATAAGIVHRAVLVGGRSYAAATAVPASARPGTLGNVTAVADLEGVGRPGFLVGSTDGFLYALDACTLELRWAYDFHYPVGEPVVGDVNGDALDDVLVTAADGYLYALDRRAHAASSEVRDAPRAEGTAPIADNDVDEIETFDTLWASWAPVEGATRYQVRITTSSGTALQFPEYVGVTENRVRVSELPLRLGGTYRVGVVAVSADGSSAEATSDGVTVVDRTPPTFSLSANRTTFAPRLDETAELTAVINDLTGLASTVVEIQDAAGSTVVAIDRNDPRTVLPTRTVRFTWAGGNQDMSAFVEAGTYYLVATATDVGGHTSTERLALTVDGRVRAPVTSGDDGGGCGCRAGSPSGGAPGSALAGLVALAALARRRRHR